MARSNHDHVTNSSIRFFVNFVPTKLLWKCGQHIGITSSVQSISSHNAHNNFGRIGGQGTQCMFVIAREFRVIFSLCVLFHFGQLMVLSVLPLPADAKLAPNYHHVFLNLSDTDDWSAFRTRMLNNDKKTDFMQFARIPLLLEMLTRRSNEILRHEILQRLFHSGQRFDLFVLGYNFNDPLLGIAAHFRCPSVVLTPTPALKMVRDFVGNPAEIATSPIFSKSGETEVPPKFLSRFFLFIGYTIEYVVTEIANSFIQEPLYAKHFPLAKGYPTYDEMKRNVSLVLVNHHFSQGDFRPLYPNIVDIGGIQIRAKPKSLPPVSVTILN